MLDTIKGFATPPVFPGDEKKTRSVKVFHALILTALGITLVLGFAILLLFPNKLLTLGALVIAVIGQLYAHHLIREGRIRSVAYTFVGGIWLLLTVNLVQGDGISNSMTAYYLVVLVWAATLLGRRAVRVYAGLTLIASFMLTVPQAFGTPPSPNAIVNWLILVSAVLITYAPLTMTLGDLQETLRNIQRQLEDRQKVDQGVRDTEAHLKLALEAANMWTWEWRMKENRMFRVSDPTEVFKAQVDENPETLFARVHPDDRQRLRDAIARCAHGTDLHYHQDYRIVWPDGTVRWITSWGQVYQDNAGTPERLIGVAQDTTERKQIEEALAKERKLLRAVVDFLPDNIYVKDRNSRFLLNNALSIQLMGASRQEDLLGKTDFDFFSAEIAGPWFAEEQAVMQTNQTVIEREEFRPWIQDKRRWIVVSQIPLKDEEGEVIGLIGRDKDITDLKRAEGRERAISKSLRGVVDAIDELIVIENLDTFYRRAVELARDRMGVERCAILLFDPSHKHIIGTYGTDDQGNTTDEHALRTTISAEEFGRLSSSRDPWIVQEMEHNFWDGEKIRAIGAGWVVDTMIRAGDEPIALFSNDAFISKAPLDTIQQESIVLYCSLLGNILNHKRVENALRESETRYRIISELISDYAYAYDVHPDGSYSMYWITEHSFKRVTGYDWNEVSRPYAVYHPDDVEKSTQNVEQVIKGQRSEGEFRIITKSGEIRWVQIQRQPEWSEAEQRVIRFYGAAKDITERKRAEEALAKERNLLRTVIDFLPDNIFVKDRNSRFILNNAVSMGLLGVSRQEDILGKSDFEFFPPEVAKPWFDQEQSIMESGQPMIRAEEFQPWHIHDWRWVVTSQIPLKNDDGEAIGLVGMTSDITQLKKVEDRERAIAQSLRGVVEAADELIATKDLDMFYRRAVELAREKLKVERCGILLIDPTREYLIWTYGTDGQGRTTDEHGLTTPLVGKSRELITSSKDSWVIDELEHTYGEGGKRQPFGSGWVAVAIIRIGDEPFAMFSNDTAITKTPPDPIQQEAIVLYCSLLGKILQNKRVEDDVRRLNAELERRVSERTRDLEIAAEVAKQVTKALDLDVLLSEMVERTCSGFDLYETSVYLYDDKTNSMSLVAAAGDYAVQATEAISEIIHLDKTKGHLTRAAITKATLLVNDVSTSPDYIAHPMLPHTQSEMIVPMMIGDQMVGALDVQRKQTSGFSQDDVRVFTSLADQIAIAIRNAQLFVEMQAARKAAEDANRIKSQFLANMSHELRTPLNAILNFTAFVADGIMGPVNQEQVEILQQSLASGKHLLSLINDILDVTKIEAGLMELFIQKVDLNQVLDATISVAKGLIKDKPIEFTVQVERGLPSTYGDIRRLRQVFLNLVSNAVKFTPRGKVSLKAHFENGVFHISVSDTGIGIAPEDQSTIFQSFKQAQNDLLEVVGTGLGLPISKYFVESHGGKIWLESEKGVGTTFFVELPILTEEQATSKNAETRT